LDSSIKVGAVVRVNCVSKDGFQLPICWGEVVARGLLALPWWLHLVLGGGVVRQNCSCFLCLLGTGMGAVSRGVDCCDDFPRVSFSASGSASSSWGSGGWVVEVSLGCKLSSWLLPGWSKFPCLMALVVSILVRRLLIGGCSGGLGFRRCGDQRVYCHLGHCGGLCRLSCVGLGCHVKGSNLACRTADSRGSVAAFLFTYTVAAVSVRELALASLCTCGVACARAAVFFC